MSNQNTKIIICLCIFMSTFLFFNTMKIVTSVEQKEELKKSIKELSITLDLNRQSLILNTCMISKYVRDVDESIDTDICEE